MKSLQTRRAFRSFAVIPALVAGLSAGTFFAVTPSASPSASAPTVPDVLAARQTTAVLTNALVAAVANISDSVPPGTSQEDIQAASDAISALLPKCQSVYRLIDASGSPLGSSNVPRGRFEVEGLAQLLGGAPAVQETIGKRVRTLVRLTNDMHGNCGTCHTNYGGLPPGTVVGAASFKVKFRRH